MADENDETPAGRAPAPTPERSFEPLAERGPVAPSEPEAPEQPRKRARPRGLPSARVDPGVVKEFEEEIVSKVTTGRKRMRWFANHIILFVVGIAVAVSLKLSIYEDLEFAFFLVPFGVWVGLLAVHANYAMNPMLRRSEKESQLKAVIPPNDSDNSDRENP
ncbi:MAG: hypothetical protein V3U48_04545 [Rhodospirillales bacterium]